MYPSSTEIKMYSAPDAVFMGKRPVRSECAVCDSGITLVNAMRRDRGCESVSVSLSSRNQGLVCASLGGPALLRQ